MTTERGRARYLSRPEFAERIGVARGESLSRYRLPEPDAQIGERMGWLPETVDTWDSVRRMQGWAQRKPEDPPYVSHAELEEAAREARRSGK